ncbi:MAG TPA: TolC family protein [Terriglobia bacterium]|nr:TolC family protein [Terriglobia bacterium]
MHRVPVVIAIYVTIALARAAFAQEPPPVTSLQSLMDQLGNNNPEIRAARFRFEAATKRPSQVGALPEPKLTLANVGVGQPFSRLNVSEFAYRGIGLAQEIPFPGKLGLAAEEARQEADSERQNYRSIVLEKASQLKTAYYDWYFATKSIEITTKNRDLLDRLEQIARARYAVGKGIQPDVLKAQVEVSGLAQQLEILEQKKLLTEARIRSLLNSELPLGRPADIQQTSLPLKLESILQMVEAQSPRLQSEQAMVQSRAVGIDRARREYRPDFNVAFQWQHTASQFPDYYMATAEIKLPVYFGRKQRLGVEEAEARFQEARENYKAARQDLVFAAKDKYFTAMTSEKLLALFQAGIIPQSSTALESALSGYEVGNVDFLTLLNNAITLLNYEMQYYQELTKHEQALAELEPLVGVELVASRP